MRGPHYSRQLLLRAMRMHNGCLGSAKQSWIRSKMNWIGSLVLVMGLASCVSNVSHNGSNASALYDPDHITLKEGVSYDFQEGVLIGRLQKFHSQYSYRRAIIVGNAK